MEYRFIVCIYVYLYIYIIINLNFKINYFVSFSFFFFRWQIPMHLRTLVLALQRGTQQDFAYIIIGKSREMAAQSDYSGAIGMLIALKTDLQLIQNVTPAIKLNRLLEWEILLYQIQQSFEEWPSKFCDNQIMISKCKQFLMTSQTGDSNYIPRIEIIDYTAVMLLNLNEWTALIFPDKRYPILELSTAFAVACLDIDKNNTKKMTREAWELILPIFYNPSLNNNSGGNNNNGNNHNNNNNNSINNNGNINKYKQQPQPLLSLAASTSSGSLSGSRDSQTINPISFNEFLKKLREKTSKFSVNGTLYT